MKKLLLIGSLVLISSFAVNASTASITVTNGSMTNLLAGFNQSAKITQVTVASASGDVSVKLVDTPDGNLNWTNTSYTTITALVTNQITGWTNFFGVMNYMTNVTLVHRTNTAAATTNAYPIRLTVTASTNQTVLYDNVNYYFNRGVYATNNGTSTATMSITFTQ